MNGSVSTPRSLRALVVEDDPAFRRAAAAMLRNIGVHRIETAEDGRQAIQAIVTAPTPFDLVLCDLNMPHEDGIVMLRRLAACSDPPPLILMSGVDPLTLDAAARLGARYGLGILGTLEKPFSLAQLQQVLSRLRQPRPAQEAVRSDPLAVAEIAAGLDEGRFEVWFQPQVSLQTRAITGIEALLRFRHWTEGLILPARFIRQAEEHGHIGRMTTLVLEQVAGHRHTWQLHHALPVSVNLSATTLHDPTCPDTMGEICLRHGLHPSNVVFELTESAAANDRTILLDISTRLRLKGFGLALDDFGTGYASLQQLHDLPFRQLKIDKWFVQTATWDERSRRIIEHSLSLALQLGLSTIAEGVDSGTGLELMTDLGCDSAQGYFIARPMPAAEVPGWLALHQSAS